MITRRDALFELWCWKRSNTGSFTCMLFDLICKADHFNVERIRRGFPEYIAAWEEWKFSANEERFLDDIESLNRIQI